MNYKSVQQEVGVTFLYKKIVFYWFYLFPLAYFIAGYLLGWLILKNNNRILNKKIEIGLFVFPGIFLQIYLIGAILLTIHCFTPILPVSIATNLSYGIMGIYTNGIGIFFILGVLISVSILNRAKRR